MKINGIDISNIKNFAYDGCHKIYLIEDEQDFRNAVDMNYYIYNINDLPEIYATSCELRFINNWKLDKTYAKQGEKAEFKGFDKVNVNNIEEIHKMITETLTNAPDENSCSNTENEMYADMQNLKESIEAYLKD